MPYNFFIKHIETNPLFMDDALDFRIKRYKNKPWKHKRNVLKIPAVRRKMNPNFEYYYKYV